MNAYTICVPANTGDDDDDEDPEHTALHKRLNAAVKRTGVGGLTTFGQVKTLSFEEIDALDPATLSATCKEIYKRVLTQQYQLPDNKPLRANPNAPLPTENSDVGQALSREWEFTW